MNKRLKDVVRVFCSVNESLQFHNKFLLACQCELFVGNLIRFNFFVRPENLPPTRTSQHYELTSHSLPLLLILLCLLNVKLALFCCSLDLFLLGKNETDVKEMKASWRLLFFGEHKWNKSVHHRDHSSFCVQVSMIDR